LDELKKMSGTYEALFSKVSRKYKRVMKWTSADMGKW
jgi:hypothetical protein